MLKARAGEGEGAYRIYELEGQTLGFRKIYDWLNKLRQIDHITNRRNTFTEDSGLQPSKR